MEWKETIRNSRCVVCGRRPVDIDHIKTRGANGDKADIPNNCWPLCREHHTEKHTIGLSTFVHKYGLGQHLIDRGFKYLDYTRSWWLPELTGDSQT